MPARTRAHIAMIGIPAVSHVLPSLEVIRELVARGHRVTYANDPAVTQVADRIAETGAELVPYPTALPVADNDWPDDPIAAMRVFVEDSIQAHPRLRAFYDADPADLYLYDIGTYAARAIAEAQGRPYLQLSPTFVAWDGYDKEVAEPLLALPGGDALRARLTEWLARCGATTTDMEEFSRRPTGSVALIPRAMQPHADRVDTGTTTFVGPCFGARTARDTWARPAGAERVLLISLGSAFTRRTEFYRRCLAAFGNLPGWHVVLGIGRHTDPGELGEIPSNVEVHPWVPQLAILEQADAFVTHAGMGGSSEGLYAGVPMIAVPQAVDQFMNADRLVELGVARRVDTEDATAEALRAALTELVDDPEVARRSARLRAEARAEGGTERAADLIEAMLG
ncbi:macrolide family glycosyltransferase [Streptomyces hainanensis]|uniref:Glycosyl transferase n=1 Tax=Streptomyces hainanensis TaxID=402648 RepID=A0A4R4TM22_9ACTN|nr:macrolide family glycosyltransferase [Streptomyces hainanensis]TDC78860.1 glycosyl transferase [Streptomyces hainanensis]